MLLGVVTEGMGDDPVRLHIRRLVSFEAEPAPAAALGQAFADLQARIDALSANPENEELHDACDATLARAAHLTEGPNLDGQMRVGARHQVMVTARWLAAMPVARRRSSGS